MGQKVQIDDYWDYYYGDTPTLNWISGNPSPLYNSLGELQNNYSDFATNLIYIITTATEHQVCLYYNNYEFCLGKNYWEGTIGVSDETIATATKNKLLLAMENALQTSSISCFSSFDVAYFSDIDHVNCFVDGFHCGVQADGRVYCVSELDENPVACAVDSDGNADCSFD